VGTIAPGFQKAHILAGLPARAFGRVAAPQHHHRAIELTAAIDLVMLQVQFRRAVFSDSGVDGLLVAEAAFIFRHGFRRDRALRGRPSIHQEIEIEFDAVADQRFRHGMGLAHQHPVEEGAGKLGIHIVEDGLCRDHIERGQALHLVWIIQRHAVAHAHATVVADHMPAFVAERRHQRHNILGKGAFAVDRVIPRSSCRLAAVAIAPHVGDHQVIVRD
jgi:hypothetical protein